MTSVGGKAVTSIDTLGAAVHAHKPSDRVSVTWVNASGSHTATVTPGAVNPCPGCHKERSGGAQSRSGHPRTCTPPYRAV